MRRSTYRKIKAGGIFVFLIVFGALVYLLNKTFTSVRNEMDISPESNTQKLDLQKAFSQTKPIGFDYQSTLDRESLNN